MPLRTTHLNNIEWTIVVSTLFSRQFTIATTVLAMCCASTVHAAEKLRLDFGVYSSNKPSAMVEIFRPVLRELEHNMSENLQREVDIRMQITKSYEQGIADLVNGDVDFSHFGPASYVEAKRLDRDISIVAVETSNNSKVSFGIIAVHNDSAIKSIEDIRGKTFAFGNQGSTIGRFLSQLVLVQANILGEDLANFEYLGRHDKVGTAVGAGAFDAGALNEKTFTKLVNAGEPIRELARFPNVSEPWIARSALEPKVLDALRHSLLQITDATVLASMNIDGFLEGKDIDYAAIHKAMLHNDAFFKERKAEQPVVSDLSAVTKEPVMQAAVQLSSDSTQTMTATVKPLAINNSLHILETVEQDPTNSQRLTVSIDMAPELFTNGRYTGPDILTIKLKMPVDSL